MKKEINPVRNQIYNSDVKNTCKCDISNGINIFYSKDWVDYELLDTGEGEKLEKFGKYSFVRPYEDAVWAKT